MAPEKLAVVNLQDRIESRGGIGGVYGGENPRIYKIELKARDESIEINHVPQPRIYKIELKDSFPPI